MPERGRDRARHARLLAVGVAVALSTAPVRAADLDCDGLLRMHGLLRNAARVCGFRRYNDAIVAQARSCYERLGSAQGARDLYAGADEFAALATLLGQDALCPDLLRQFPMVVRP